MKRFFKIFAASAAVLAGLVSCNESQEPRIEGNLVISAKATVGTSVFDGEIDHNNHTVSFAITELGADPTEAKVKITFAEGAVFDESLREFPADLTKAVKFIVNDRYDDVEYTILPCKVLKAVAVNKERCSGIFGTKGDLTYPQGCIKGQPVAQLFDEVRAETWKSYSGYKYFGMSMNPNDAGIVIPDDVKDGGYTAAPVFDFGSEMKLSKIVFWPYWEYTNNNYHGLIEIYAWTGKDKEIAVEDGSNANEYVAADPVAAGDWTNWKLIGTIDERERCAITAFDSSVSPVASTLELKYDDVPEARYYRFKITNRGVVNGAAEAWHFRYSFSEIDIEKYLLEEYE